MSTYSSHLLRTLSLILAITSLVLLLFAGVAAAQASSDRILSADQYTSEKGRRLAQNYAGALRELNEGVYHCLPWQGEATTAGRSTTAGDVSVPGD